MEHYFINLFCLREVFEPDILLKLVTESKNRGLRLPGNKSSLEGLNGRWLWKIPNRMSLMCERYMVDQGSILFLFISHWGSFSLLLLEKCT